MGVHATEITNSSLRLFRDGAIARVGLDRPERRNSLNHTVIDSVIVTLSWDWIGPRPTNPHRRAALDPTRRSWMRR